MAVVHEISPYFVEMYNMPLMEAVLPASNMVSSYVAGEIVAVSLLSLLFAGATLFYMLRRV
ncbi:MAG: hypothetical protein H6765_06780 [Candidatus Peribacteria bacterium]|nr:MAG: hypothetical protein H6765_06780 [Candidatus Peribacteria bacterium]